LLLAAFPKHQNARITISQYVINLPSIMPRTVFKAAIVGSKGRSRILVKYIGPSTGISRHQALEGLIEEIDKLTSFDDYLSEDQVRSDDNSDDNDSSDGGGDDRYDDSSSHEGGDDSIPMRLVNYPSGLSDAKLQRTFNGQEHDERSSDAPSIGQDRMWELITHLEDNGRPDKRRRSVEEHSEAQHDCIVGTVQHGAKGITRNLSKLIIASFIVAGAYCLWTFVTGSSSPLTLSPISRTMTVQVSSKTTNGLRQWAFDYVSVLEADNEVFIRSSTME
jgi:hypothetical protein